MKGFLARHWPKLLAAALVLPVVALTGLCLLIGDGWA